MADSPKRSSNLLQFALIFAAVYFGSQLLLRFLFPQQFSATPQVPGIFLRMTDDSITVGHEPIVNIDNKTASGITLASRCPQPPVDVYYIETSGTQETLSPLTSSGGIKDCVSSATAIAAGASKTITLQPWKYALFSKLGTYELRLPGQASSSPGTSTSGTGTIASAQSTQSVRFTLSEPGVFTKLFRTFITAPFLNFLIFIASLLPDHNLGIAIILLTLAVKLLLFWPTQHALEGQKKMQMLQPKLEALKKKYPNDPKKVQEETMKLWTEHKINPLQSCLPTLIQFPVLIGLLYVIRDGSHLDYSKHLIYSAYQHLDWSFGTHFLGLDLLKPNIWVMPALLVVLQFTQMKLAFAIQARKTKKADTSIIDVPAKGDKPAPEVSAQNMQQNIMLYGLPLMIGFFALQFPAAVALYWGVSTLFGIGQQLIVNREHLRV